MRRLRESVEITSAFEALLTWEAYRVDRLDTECPNG